MNALDRIRGGLVVSCQAYPGEPLRDPGTMARMARAAERGGAVGIRAQGLADIELIHRDVALPQIGLWKDGDADVFITPTVAHARAVAQAGAEIVAIDGTRRPRPDGYDLAETIARIRDVTDALIMADVGSFPDGIAAAAAGADCVGTTLAGYTGERPATNGPDFELLDALVAMLRIPVIAEGRIHSPDQAKEAIERGAYAVVVGTAITHPTTLTEWFAAAVGQAHGSTPFSSPS
ncbi:MAG: N-acetylmannosamine-6-phosphate 2-epimerase [Protaetiibacter sp.]